MSKERQGYVAGTVRRVAGCRQEIGSVAPVGVLLPGQPYAAACSFDGASVLDRVGRERLEERHDLLAVVPGEARHPRLDRPERARILRREPALGVMVEHLEERPEGAAVAVRRGVGDAPQRRGPERAERPSPR